jgi:DNA primase
MPGNWPPLPPSPSDSLKLSSLAQPGAAKASVREAVILRTLLNHPWLLDDVAEDLVSIDFRDKMLVSLRDAILRVHAEHSPLDSAQLADHLERLGLHDTLTDIQRARTHQGDRFADPDASAPEVTAGWRHMLALQRREVDYAEELRAAERAWMSEGSESALAAINDIRQRMLLLHGSEGTDEEQH